ARLSTLSPAPRGPDRRARGRGPPSSLLLLLLGGEVGLELPAPRARRDPTDLDGRVHVVAGGAGDRAAERRHVVVVATVADLDVAEADLPLVGRVEPEPAEPRDRRLEPGVGLHL